MGADAGRIVRAGVIADEDGRVDRLVDARHHAETSGPGADDTHVGRELLDQQVLPVAVRVGDDDLGRAGGLCRLDGSERLAGHELPEAAVLEPGRPELFAGDDAGDTFHVDRDVNLQLSLAAVGPRAPRRQAAPPRLREQFVLYA